MTSRRDQMLKEIGLTPIWRLRAREDVATADADDETVTVGPRVAAGQERDGAAFRIPGSSTSSPASAVTRAPSSVEPDDRRTAIMRMDWAALKEAVAQCVACPLHAKRRKTVFGVGDENADWVFVGEGPGADEDVQGEPFVGQAGRLLDSMLAAIELKRGENVYIANVVKCRPPGNRNPEPAEAQKCEPFLQRQIELIRPKVIIGLGRVAAINLLAREASIASLRGRVHEYRGIPLIITYHPAYLLRTLTDKAKAWEDLCFAVKIMQALQSEASAST